MNSFQESLFTDHSQVFGVDAVLHHGHTGLQDALVFRNPTFGRVLVLDGIVQLTERDNHIYHETISHVPLVLHGKSRRVLIIGGGDGGTLKEVLKHPVDDVRLVEIDREVIELAERFFPSVSERAFQDPRASIVVEDARQYVARCPDSFDAILIDSTDPVGPGEQLFSADFYARCRELLAPNGVLVVQSGAAPHNAEHLGRICDVLASTLGAAEPFVAPVPSYPGGMLALVAASRSARTLKTGTKTLQRRFRYLQGQTRFYTPETHRAAFTLAKRFSLPAVSSLEDDRERQEPVHAQGSELEKDSCDTISVS